MTLDRKKLSSETKQEESSSSSSLVNVWIQSKLAQLITNCSSTSLRVDIPWQDDPREPGWTETWGTRNPEDAAIPREESSSSSSSRKLLELHQYRVAWYEQMVMQVCQIPYQVTNSTYYSMESTGPLPVLKDYHHGAIMGRYSSTTTSNDNNNSPYYYSQIVRYLHDCQLLPLEFVTHVDLPSYMVWIHTVLQQQILQTVRFHDDDGSWYDVERSNALQARTHHWGGRYQAWAEHVTSTTTTPLSLEQALELAQTSYATLETKLSSSKQYFLLGTSQPTLVDCYLFDHFANALTNVHLIVLLANYPNILSYFQRLYQQYYSTTTTDHHHPKQVNSTNAFLCQSIFNDTDDNDNGTNKKNKKTQKKYETAMELMQSLAIHSHDPNNMNKIVKDVQYQRSNQDDILSNHQKKKHPFQTIHRLLHGGNLFPNKKDDEEEEEEEDEMTRKTKEQMKLLKRESETQDQIWISGVAVITAITLYMSILSNK